MSEQHEKFPEKEGEVLLVVSDVAEAEEKQDPEEESGEKVSSILMPGETEDEPCKSNNEVLRKGVDFFTENEKKALQEVKRLLEEAFNRQEFGVSSPKQGKIEAKLNLEGEKDPSFPVQTTTIAKALLEDDGTKTLEAIEETIVASIHSSKEKTGREGVSIWGVKLLEEERSDVILLKFLQARDFKVKEAFSMIKNTLKWRKEFRIDEVVEEDLDLDKDLGKVVYMYGHNKGGHPVCYNVYGEFQDRELYDNTFSDEEKRHNFLKWRIQFLERSIRKLDFRPGGISTIVQVNDLRNSPGPNRWELRQATNQALHLLQDNYPEFVAKQIFINVPWWYLALSKMISPFLTQRTKSKFVVAGPSTSTEALLKYISGEQIPTQYGGLSKEGDFDSVTEFILKPSAKHIIEFPVTQECIVRWEARVVGWEVSYGAEFVPSAENGYTVIIQKTKNMMTRNADNEVMSCSYRAVEAGKVVVAITNHTAKKKVLLYRFNSKAVNEFDNP